MEVLPWWIYAVILGIVVSGYMVLYTSKKEKEIDNEFIEREGNVYLERIQAEKEKRAKEDNDNSLLL
ncbi:sporulation YhaL family protein [Microbacteriaceae bacterium 4G12]